MTESRLSYSLWLTAFALSAAVMLYASFHKTVVIPDASEGSIISMGSIATSAAHALKLKSAETEGRMLNIPLRKGIKAENIIVDSNYGDKTLKIYIEGEEGEYYSANQVYGDVSAIVQAEYETTTGGVILIFSMDNIYEYRTTMTDGLMTVEIYRPHELYEMVALIDPVAEEGAAKEPALSVAELTERIYKTDKDSVNEGIKLYFANKRKLASREEKAEMLRESDADIYIALSCRSSDDAAEYGISVEYDPEFFIPDFGNTELSEIMLKEVALSSVNSTAGFYAAEDDDILYDIALPACRVNLGYSSNAKENELMGLEEYHGLLSKGLINGINEVYEKWQKE